MLYTANSRAIELYLFGNFLEENTVILQIDTCPARARRDHMPNECMNNVYTENQSAKMHISSRITREDFYFFFLGYGSEFFFLARNIREDFDVYRTKFVKLRGKR